LKTQRIKIQNSEKTNKTRKVRKVKENPSFFLFGFFLQLAAPPPSLLLQPRRATRCRPSLLLQPRRVAALDALSLKSLQSALPVSLPLSPTDVASSTTESAGMLVGFHF
jgi:hypothetical protein